eukprot:15447124-Alexandrium_andersonii.AAC.1
MSLHCAGPPLTARRVCHRGRGRRAAFTRCALPAPARSCQGGRSKARHKRSLHAQLVGKARPMAGSRTSTWP